MAVNTVPVELEASLEDVDYWTPEEVRQVVDRAARGDRSSLQLVHLWMDMAHARILGLVQAFLGDGRVMSDGFSADFECPMACLKFIIDGKPSSPRSRPDYVPILKNVLEDIVRQHPTVFYYLPPYNHEESWKRCIVDYLLVFIDRFHYHNDQPLATGDPR